MSSDFRKQRIGVTHAARLLDVRVTELREAVHRETPLRGHPPPTPVMRGSTASLREMYFNVGEILDLAQALGSRHV